MKKNLITILIALVIGQTISIFAVKGKVNFFSGQAKGFVSDIKLAADFDGNKVIAVKVLEHSETPIPGGEALKKLSVSSIGKDLSQIDSIAGATYSSKGFKAALESALNNKNKEF